MVKHSCERYVPIKKVRMKMTTFYKAIKEIGEK